MLYGGLKILGIDRKLALEAKPFFAGILRDGKNILCPGSDTLLDPIAPC